MQYSVIYTANWERPYPGQPSSVHLSDVQPKPSKRGLWTRTEKGDQSDYEDMNHGKWVAILDQEQFDEFVEDAELHADTTPTMGSIGAPGFGFSHVPAIAFTNAVAGGEVDAFRDAYVTPVPCRRDGSLITEHLFDERNWDRIVEAVLSKYGR